MSCGFSNRLPYSRAKLSLTLCRYTCVNPPLTSPSRQFSGGTHSASPTLRYASALSCVPLVLQNFPKVYLDSLGAETLGDVDTLRADFSLTLSGETLACSLWLDASGAPVYAEIAENDKIIAAAEFTNFIFGDILSPDAAQ